MQRTRRVAAAVAASTLVVAGAITAFALSAGAAKADGSFGPCTIDKTTTGTPQTCKIAVSGQTTFTVTSPASMSLEARVTSANAASINMAWTSTCVKDGQPVNGPQAGNSDSTGGGDGATTIFGLRVDPQDMNAMPDSCTVTATLTAKTAVAGTDTETLTLNVASQQPTSQPTSSSAAPSPSASPTSSAPGSAGLTGVVRGFDGKCLDDLKNSSSLRATVAIWSCHGGDKAEQWTYAGGEVKHNGLCLNAKGGGGSGSKVILWTCNGAANEIWIFNTLNHQVLLKAHGFSVCLDDPGFSIRNGTQLIVYSCKNSPNQHWSLP